MSATGVRAVPFAVAVRVAPFENVLVEPFHDLTVQFVRRIGARVILRGLRTLSDMEYEFSMTMTNYRLDPEVETVFLMADVAFQPIASRLVKEIAAYGGKIDSFVPPAVAEDVRERLAGRR